jgi:hypothetical protein
MQPRQMRDTSRPVRPSFTYSMAPLPQPADDTRQRCRRPRPADRLVQEVPASSRADPAEVFARYGAETPMLDWRERLVCSRCGSRQVDFMQRASE